MPRGGAPQKWDRHNRFESAGTQLDGDAENAGLRPAKTLLVEDVEDSYHV